MNRGLATIAVLLFCDYGTTIERLYFQKWKELLKMKSDYSCGKMNFVHGASIERLSKIISSSTIERLSCDYGATMTEELKMNQKKFRKSEQNLKNMRRYRKRATKW